ncbi:MAG: FtsX-like permease family protein [Chitinophagaceae bacterium]
MNFLFAWRYFNAKKSTNAINIIAWISVLAMGTGTAALIILLSIFNGFEDLVKSLYADFYTDLKVSPVSGKILQLTDELKQKIATWPGVSAVSMTVEEKALLQNGDYPALVLVKGVDENYQKVTNVSGRMIRGKFLLGDADKPAVVLGVGVENALGIESDRSILPLTVYLPRKGMNKIEYADPLQSLGADNIAASGAFAIQQDFDNNYAITNIGFVKRMLGLQPNEYGAVEIAISDKEQAAQIKKGLEQLLGKNYRVETMYEQNRSLYTTMRNEKWFIFVLLSFILVVAAFTMIGALTMLVLEKQKDIQILKAMGSSNGQVQKIFLSEGLLLAVIGGAGGVLLAFIIGWLQVKFKLIKLQGSTFLIDHYPVKFLPADVILVFITVVLIALIASWFPSRKAAMQAIALKS